MAEVRIKVPSPPREGVCPLSTRQIVDRAIQFAEEINNRKFYNYQTVFARRIVTSVIVRDGDSVTGLFSRQSGKTEVCACLGLALTLLLPSLAKAFPNDNRFKGFREGFLVGIFAPTAKHSGLIYARMKSRVESFEFEDILVDPDIDTGLAHSRGDSFAFTNGSRVEAHTASENVLNEGGTYHLVLIDESQKISVTKINKELRPMLAKTNGTMVLIGTAFVSGGAFYKQINLNIKIEKKSGKRSHFQFDYKQVIKDRRSLYNQDGNPEHLFYEKWVQAELARLGGNEDDDSFKMNFRLLWHESTVQAIKMHVFNSLARSELEMNRPWVAGGRIVAGMDVAKSNDHTWITVGHVDTDHPIVDVVTFGQQTKTVLLYRVTVIGWMMMQGNFEGEYGQYNRAVSFLSLWPQLSTLVVDSTGMGDPVFERMAVMLPSVSVQPFRYHSQSKSELYKLYLQEISARRFGYCAGKETQQSYEYKEFIRQHEELVKEYQGQYITCHAAEEDDHDDAPDSAALMVWASQGEEIPTVDVFGGGVSTGHVPFVDAVDPVGPHLIPYGRRYR